MALTLIILAFIVALIVILVRMGGFGLAPRIIAIVPALGSGLFAWDEIGSRLQEIGLVAPTDIELSDAQLERANDNPAYARFHADLRNNSAHPVRQVRIRVSVRDCPLEAPQKTGAAVAPAPPSPPQQAAEAVAAPTQAPSDLAPQTDTVVVDEAQAVTARQGRDATPAPAIANRVDVAALEAAVATLDSECRVIGSKVIRPELDIPAGQVRAVRETFLYEQLPEIEGRLIATYHVTLVLARTRREVLTQLVTSAGEQIVSAAQE